MKNILPVLLCLAVSASLLWARKAGDSGDADGDRIEALPAARSSYLWHSWTLLTRRTEKKPPDYAGRETQVGSSNPLNFDIHTLTPGVPPAGPGAAPGKIKKKRHRKNATVKEAAPEKPAKRRKKRVSRLREPGEAMGGGKENKIEAEAQMALKNKNAAHGMRPGIAVGGR